MKKILVTGGAGYIGSHTTLVLLQRGFDVVVLDNFCNSAVTALMRVESIAKKSITVLNGDVRDVNCLSEVFSQHDFAAVIHFAGLKAVGESVREPLRYYDNNVVGTLRLIDAMGAANVERLIFSSSATVYAASGKPRFTETSPLGPASPYGTSKLMAEQLLRDVCVSNAKLKVALLRYFNPVGAHESGLLGEDPNGIPNNLMPFISQVAVGKLKTLSIYGNDYPTPDGTGIRDYIHVMDLAEGHLAALDAIDNLPQVSAINLGSGNGHSVMDVIRAFESASGRKIDYKVVARRDGDIADYFADAALAKQCLGWQTKRTLNEMCADSWRWQQQNPDGYASVIAP
jgi:UDP-glucose 4-epimerase